MGNVMVRSHKGRDCLGDAMEAISHVEALGMAYEIRLYGTWTCLDEGDEAFLGTGKGIEFIERVDQVDAEIDGESTTLIPTITSTVEVKFGR